MEPKLTVLGETGLRFFGNMSAANAHEIKNALAIINENAGLLEDLVHMMGQGVPLDPHRLRRLAAKIKQQVSRADEIAKSTNRFAHSVDRKHGPADLEQSLVLIKTMAMRFATQRHIDLEILPLESPITLPVQPFMLLHLLWLCLQCAMETINSQKSIQIEMIRSPRDHKVRFGPLSHLKASTLNTLRDSTETKALIDFLGVKIEADLQRGYLVLTFMKQSGS
jgi:C4-dicarboxylate-specific signal transduction histidine kinase